MGATAGDLLTRDLVCRWLEDAGRPYDVAVAPPFVGGISWNAADPADYSDVVFVCGPFGNGWPIPNFLERFAARRLIGINLSMIEPLEAWNPFDLLLERDSSRAVRADLAFISHGMHVPVVGVVVVHPQAEYGNRGSHETANAAVQRLIATREMAVVPIDTRLDLNTTGLRNANEVESLVARMDAVITTRLHGMVLALKNSVPPVVIDPIAGGAKVRRQAIALGWPLVFAADTVSDPELQSALETCLSDSGRLKAAECRVRAEQSLATIRAQFLKGLWLADQKPGD